MDTLRAYDGPRILMLNCRHISKVYDTSSASLNVNFSYLMSVNAPDMLVLIETRVSDNAMIPVLIGLAGFDRYVAVPGSSSAVHPGARPTGGIVVAWKNIALHVTGTRRGRDCISLDVGHGCGVLAAYSPPFERGASLLSFATHFFNSFTRCVVLGDLNPESNGTAVFPYLYEHGLAPVPSPHTTRGTNPHRAVTDVVWASSSMVRSAMIFVFDWDAFSKLSDYHHPVALLMPRSGFIIPHPVQVTWRSGMVKMLAVPPGRRCTSLCDLVSSITLSNPSGNPTCAGVSCRSLIKVFYSNPKRFVSTLLGGNFGQVSAPRLKATERVILLDRLRSRYSSNPPADSSRVAVFRERYLSNAYGPRDRFDIKADSILLSPVAPGEVILVIGSLEDSASQDLALAVLRALPICCIELIADTFSAWVSAGHCLEPDALKLAYSIIPKRGVLSLDQNRVIIIEKAIARVWWSLLDSRLQKILGLFPVLAPGNVGFRSDHSAVEVNVVVSSLIAKNSRPKCFFVCTVDWTNAYDLLNYSIFIEICDYLFGGRRFATLVTECMSSVEKTLFYHRLDKIGDIGHTLNGGGQGNPIMATAWSIYVDPLARVISRTTDLPHSSWIYADDALSVRATVGSSSRFFDDCDEYMVLCGNPLPRKVQAIANGFTRASCGVAAIPRASGPPVPIVGAGFSLGQEIHLDGECALQPCKYCDGRGQCKTCEGCLSTLMQRLRSIPLSMANRASVVKFYVLGPMRYQCWLCPGAFLRCIGKETAAKRCLHNGHTNGPNTMALELDTELGGAGLGNISDSIAMYTILEFIWCATGPYASAGAIRAMWAGSFLNPRVAKSLKRLKAGLSFETDISESEFCALRRFRASPPCPKARVIVARIAWTAYETFDLVCYSIHKGNSHDLVVSDLSPLDANVQGLFFRQVYARSSIVAQSEEAELASIWCASNYVRDDECVILTTPISAERVLRFDEERPRQRSRLAFNDWLQAIVTRRNHVLACDTFGIDPLMMRLHVSEGYNNSRLVLLKAPLPVVTLQLPGGVTVIDRFHEHLHAHLQTLQLQRIWSKVQESGGNPSYRAPAPGIGFCSDLGWRQSAKVLYTKQYKVAITSPLKTHELNALFNLRRGGRVQSGLVATTRCGCGRAPPYDLLHLLGTPVYLRALKKVNDAYTEFFNAYSLPRWWAFWPRSDSRLLTAMGWVPSSVERILMLTEGTCDKATANNVAETVLDVQLTIVRAFLEAYWDHQPLDGRPDAPVSCADEMPPANVTTASEDVLVQRRDRRFVGKPTVSDLIQEYSISAPVIISFDGGSRHHISASAAVILDNRGSLSSYHFAYVHPIRRTPAQSERISFILAYVAHRFLTDSGILPIVKNAWCGDNETMMLQHAGKYRSRAFDCAIVTSFLRDGLSSSDTTHAIRREFNWEADGHCNKAMDNRYARRYRCSDDFDPKEIIRIVEEIWGVIKDGAVPLALPHTDIEEDSDEDAFEVDGALVGIIETDHSAGIND